MEVLENPTTVGPSVSESDRSTLGTDRDAGNVRWTNIALSMNVSLLP